ncbi:MAG: flap endonuclease-1 [Candidatus Diapherotrites archaeon]|nr:flap endonuclease-1 [Candidatus Diapherotrites archaeon]
MGVNLSDLAEKKEISLDFLAGKRVGIDSYNMLYQFLASIRGADGLPLADSHGNTTSHLAGLFYRTINLIEKEIQPIYIFDGKPPELKRETLRKRRAVRTDAEEKSSTALKEGNLEEARKMGSRALKMTPEMVEEAKQLLRLMGIPVIESPQEGEAQASVMASKGQLFGVASQDFDCLLFGANNLFRNVGITGKRKVAGKNFYVEIRPQHIELNNVLKQLRIDRRKLIWLGILIGTDFNEKFPKIGPKTALKLVQQHNSFEEIISAAKFEPEFDYKEIENVFMNPSSREVDAKEFEIKKPDKEKLVDFLVAKHDFSAERIGNALDRIISAREEKEKQKSINQWFG